MNRFTADNEYQALATKPAFAKWAYAKHYSRTSLSDLCFVLACPVSRARLRT